MQKARSHLSSISEEECNILRKAVKGDNTKKVEKPNQDNKKEKMKKETVTPVIIRREIIINEDEHKNK